MSNKRKKATEETAIDYDAPGAAAISEKTKPYNLRNERAFLASVMIRPDEFDNVSGIIEGGAAFFDRRNAVIYEAMCDLSMEGRQPAFPLVIEKLKSTGKFDRVGGEGYLKELYVDEAYSYSSTGFAKLIANDHMKRKIIELAADISEMSYNSEDSVKILEEAERRIFDLSTGRDRKDLVLFKDALEHALTSMVERSKSDGKLRGVTSGYEGVDDFTLGFKKGELTLLAARPSMGKTAFALNICQNVSREGVVAIFSLEMDAASLAERIISSETRIPLNSGRLTGEQLDRIAGSMSRLKDRKIYIDDTSGVSIQQMRSKLRGLKAREKRLDLIMIDYLQLMEAPGMENRQQEISYISRSLKAIAKEFECPVLALSQLSRASEKRGTSKKPILSDLRESGAIEQDADIVMFIHRPEYYLMEKTPPELKGIAEIIFAKQRNGKTGTLYMAWTADIVRFDDIDFERQEAAMRVNKD
ncbi:MAG: replicative DNA helicase [Bacillota bacterium]|nr:replicative DNA helicase [Bacillota bacterium]